ncbi:mechanosensitive ion channel family protein [Saccharopolyspora cebuensis]|uniref:mechanosensitive ion channel family protein n=1 Tax=Saccharopolyspora cebuensis TaxID=418759 RepID=UPI0031E81EFF
MFLAQQPGGGFNVLQGLQSAFTQLLNYLPQIIGALLVLLIGYVVARLIKAGLTKLLNKFRLDERMTSSQGGHYVERFSPRGSPARLVGTVVFAVIMVFVVSSAIGTLGIPALTGFMNTVLGYLPRVVAALLIFLVAAAVAGAVGGVAHRTMGDTPTGRVVRTAAPTLVMAIAVFMILTQLQIAPTIVTITYVALIGALALGSALAFGLGGREAAADLINSGYRRAQQEQETVKRDMRAGRERAEDEAAQRTSPQEGGIPEQDQRRTRAEADTGRTPAEHGRGSGST